MNEIANNGEELLKIPDKVLLKMSRKEIGELKSLLDEKEYKLGNISSKLDKANKRILELETGIDDRELKEERLKIKTSEMWISIKKENTRLRTQLRSVRQSKSELLNKMVISKNN